MPYIQSLSGHTSGIDSVSFDSSEVLVAAGAASGTIKLWDLEEAKSMLFISICHFHWPIQNISSTRFCLTVSLLNVINFVDSIYIMLSLQYDFVCSCSYTYWS